MNVMHHVVRDKRKWLVIMFVQQILWPAATVTSSVHHLLTVNLTTAGHESASVCGTLQSGESLSKYTVTIVVCGYFVMFIDCIVLTGIVAASTA